MSLVRWSTIVNNPFSEDEEIKMMMDRVQLEERLAKAQEINPEAYLSDWYIFWYSYSEDSVNETEPKLQALAMWLADEDLNPVADYETVKEMYDSDDWTKLGIEIRQKDLLRDCVKRWMEQVNERHENRDKDEEIYPS